MMRQAVTLESVTLFMSFAEMCGIRCFKQLHRTRSPNVGLLDNMLRPVVFAKCSWETPTKRSSCAEKAPSLIKLSLG